VAYLAASLPTLPFEAESFDLVLCGQGVAPMLLLKRGRAD
jgi:ubiquinone/menaquinone biosynthesis C-methylase UbiE